MSTEESAEATSEARDEAGTERPAGASGADERRRILSMVSEGKLAPDEAAELLSSLEPEPAISGARGSGAFYRYVPFGSGPAMVGPRGVIAGPDVMFRWDR